METTSPERAQHIVELLTKGQFDQVEERLAEAVKPFLPPELLEAGWQGLEAQWGAFQRVVGVKTVQTPQAQVEVVTCAFAQATVDVNLIFNANAEILSLTLSPAGNVYDPPAYAHPDQFEEHEVQVGAGEWALPGTLSLPKGQGPFPAVVLVHGSGPQDRDETIPPNKPFRDVAW
jgi:hypothetical protein